MQKSQLKSQLVESKEREKNVTIATSNDLLIGAQWPYLDRYEQRIVIHMMSLIKKDDRDFQDYKISIKELREIFNLRSDGGAVYKQFDKAIKGLMSKTIKFIDPSYKKAVKEVEVAWCSYAAKVKGEGFVELRFDPALKPFMIALKGNFTIWGDRRSLLSLNTHYGLRLYQFIKYSQGMGRIKKENSTIVTIKWIKEYLAIGSGKYKIFGHLKSRVLIPAQKEINTKTDVEIRWKPIKQGKKFVALEFFWKENPNHKQLLLPGHGSEGNSITDILTIEFGVNEKKATLLTTEYSTEKIKTALQEARDYITMLEKTGEKIKNRPGIAIKAIENGWRTSSFIDIELEKEKMKRIEEAKNRNIREKQKQTEEETRTQKALNEYNKLKADKKEAILGTFREYLLSMGNLRIVSKYDTEGITPGALEALFSDFIVNCLDLLN